MPRLANYRWIEPPPKRRMRRQSPVSAPKLFEWLVDNGYVEAVTTLKGKRGKQSSAASRSKRRSTGRRSKR